ncbi:MAG: methylmalonyl Co-A mutase-associated GTPase MeaB [Alphaproteobacteria bacterium]
MAGRPIAATAGRSRAGIEADGAVEQLAKAVADGDRRALARAITLIESTRLDHRERADSLIARLLPLSGRSIRIGISGVPGVGKSSLIETIGLHAIARGYKVAVLTVDPSSKRSGGSILGDKTRMDELARNERSFIRPSPAGGALGGVARRTREAMLACESAGFEAVIVETVGVGQAETAVADMVDMFVLLVQPGGGDELQGLKRGIMELADMVVVTKADGELEAAANRAAADYRMALSLLRPVTPNWTAPVLQCSAHTGRGIGELWDEVERYRRVLGASGDIGERRALQARAWLWRELSESLLDELSADPRLKAKLGVLEAMVAGGKVTPGAAARSLLAAFLGREPATADRPRRGARTATPRRRVTGPARP